MTHEEALDRVQKLLRLSKSDNANEAAVAAAMAQKIMTDFKLSSAAMLDSAEQTNEPVTNETMDPSAGSTWKRRLSVVVARANDCKAYQSGKAMALIGRKSDMQTASYIYRWLVVEIDRLTSELGTGLGRTYYNNFRLGAVSGISEKLAEQKKKSREEAKANAFALSGEVGLANMNSAIVRVDGNMAAVELYGKQKLRLRTVHSAPTAYDGSAYTRGQNAGRNVNFGARNSLGAGRNLLK